jgi:hypothetical protein
MTTKETQAHPVPKEDLNPAGIFAHPMKVVSTSPLSVGEQHIHEGVLAVECQASLIFAGYNALNFRFQIYCFRWCNKFERVVLTHLHRSSLHFLSALMSPDPSKPRYCRNASPYRVDDKFK